MIHGWGWEKLQKRFEWEEVKGLRERGGMKGVKIFKIR